jgi:hypothetical protein
MSYGDLFLHEQQFPEQHPLKAQANNIRIVQLATVFTVSTPVPTGALRESERSIFTGIHSGTGPFLNNHYRRSGNRGTLNAVCPICPSV